MCRLLGIIGTPPLPITEVLEAFYPLCTKGCVKKGMKPGHLDGWGASGFKDTRAVYFGRQADPVNQNEANYKQAEDRALKARTPILIAHFRKATGGAPGIANTHPFHARDWIFAHNGTIFGAAASFSLNETAPLGETDSERFFLWLWEEVHAAVDPTAALAALLKKSREQLVYTSLNFLMSDGQTLWAYRDYGDKRLELGETLEEREKYYTLYTAKLDKSAVVCSEPLLAVTKSWKPIAQRTLVAFTLKALTPQLISI
jgi:predicted glutamine amidotransferase